MVEFPTLRVAEQAVAVENHLPSRLLIASRPPRIPLQRLDPVGKTEHQRRRHDLVGQADVGELRISLKWITDSGDVDHGFR